MIRHRFGDLIDNDRGTMWELRDKL